MPSSALSRTSVSVERKAAVPHVPSPPHTRGVPRFLQGHAVTVSEPSDPSEQHADRVAAQVMAAEPCPTCAAGLPCTSCGAHVARSAEGPAPSSVPGGPGLGSGQPLRHDARSFFEPRFGRDLGGVRVHADGAAGELAGAFSARAFATGHDIVFGDGEYAPETDAGRHLLAHELAHVVEPASPGTVSRQPAPVDAGVPGAGAAAGSAAAAAAAGAGSAAGAAVPGVVPPAGPIGPSIFDAMYGACASPAETARRDAFALRSFRLNRYIPSTTFGMFDADYFPLAGVMVATVKVKFNFVDADNTPSMWGLMRRIARGQDIKKYFWSDTEKADFKRDFISRVSSRWSAQHTMTSTKPCWPFTAVPLVTPIEVSTDAAAHYVTTVHKSPGPNFDYKSSTSDPNVAQPNLPATADLWSSDVRENPDFNSVDVARNERIRLEAALFASGGTPVFFDKNQDVVKPAARAGLTTFANALKQKNPSDPLIPVTVDGFASAEGDLALNQDLSDRRAGAVRDFLTGLSIPQPVGMLGHGAVGTPDDAANRKVDVALDRTFEGTYASNRYSVAEHEFGHMLGLPDEYQNNTTGTLGTQQALYMALVTAAGANGPAAWGSRTSSQMASGVDVLPRHYVTLWEALGRMTSPDITQAQWNLQ